MRTPSKITTISILSLSTVTGVSTLITGIIPQLKNTYPSIPVMWIEWLVTIANLSALLTLVLNPKLTQKFGSRKVVVGGLVISALSGATPLFISNFVIVMLSRIILGLGIGLLSPHAISLIAHNFDGEHRAKLLGYQVGISAGGNAILLMLAGILVTINWRFVFVLYLLLLIIAGLVFKNVPNDQPETIKNSSVKLPPNRWGILILAFLTYLLIWGVQLKLPTLFNIKGFGNSILLNWTLAAMNLGGLVAGLTFSKLHRRFNRYTLTIGYAGAAIAVFLLISTNNTFVAVFAAIFFNYIYSYTGPYLVLVGHQNLTDPQINVMSSYITVSTIISAFFAPLVWNLVGKIGVSSLTVNSLFWVGAVLSLIAIGTVLKSLLQQRASN